VAGVLTPDRAPGERWEGEPILGDDDWLRREEARRHRYVIGIGAVPGKMGARQRMFLRLDGAGLAVAAVVHPAAIVSKSAALAVGIQILAGAVVQAGARLGDNVLINTGARIDHDVLVGAGAHIAPGAIVCGNVCIGAQAFVGAGAVVLPGVQIGRGAEIAAGATVTRDIPAFHRYIPGHPLKPLEGQPC
jgi:UDP-perosamine 4-acetyltransferase